MVLSSSTPCPAPTQYREHQRITVLLPSNKTGRTKGLRPIKFFREIASVRCELQSRAVSPVTRTPANKPASVIGRLSPSLNEFQIQPQFKTTNLVCIACTDK